ncbi:MAG: spore germination protein [Clostridia bacterium]|nr:spore germination protein [Clostridia bacterium]
MNTRLTVANLKAQLEDPDLRIDILSSPRNDSNSLALAYIDGLVELTLVESVKSKLLQELTNFPSNETLLDGLTNGKNKWHPYPLMRRLENLDDVVINLRTGHLVVLGEDGIWAAAIPTSLFDLLRASTDYRLCPMARLLVRLLRAIAILISIFLTPLWLLVSLYPGLLPSSLRFLGLSGLEVGQVSLLGQLLMTELVFDLGRLLVSNGPYRLGTPLLLIALILTGQVGVGVGLLAPETVFYSTLVALGVLATPDVDLSWANTLARILLLVATGVFGLAGFILVLLFLFALLAGTKSFGLPYLWPLVPFNWRAIKAAFAGLQSGMKYSLPGPARKPRRR